MVNSLSHSSETANVIDSLFWLYLKIALFPFFAHVENTIIPTEGNKSHMQSHFSEVNTVDVLVYNRGVFSLCTDIQISSYRLASCCCLVAQSCPALMWPCGLWPARFLCPRDSLGKNTGVRCHFLLQGIFPILGLNPYLLHCRWILYCWANREAHRLA